MCKNNKIKTHYKYIILVILILANLLSVGATPISTHDKITNNQDNFSKYKTTIENTPSSSILTNIEVNNFVDNFIFSIEEKEIEKLLEDYKKELIFSTNQFVENKDYTSSANLLNSRKKYYKNDDTINNLLTLSNKLRDNESLVQYQGEIEHLCFNPLIAFPEKAFNENNHLRNQYDSTKITAFEFQNILNELYRNNYILIDIEDVFETNNDTLVKKELRLPQNKKPLLLSFDNTTYQSNYQNLGEIDKLIIDRNNQLATYTTKQSVQDRIAYDNESILILENFIKKNPDFSHNNARGIIFFTGENGILGYNISHKNASSKFEKKRVLEVIKKLKSLGWKFGSNGYRNIDNTSISDMEFAKNLSLWNNEIRPIIGNTPYFAHLNNTHNTIGDNKKELLYTDKYYIFFENDICNKITNHNNIAILNRKVVNGETLRTASEKYSHLFNSYNVYDHNNRHINYHKKTSGE